MSEKAKNSFKRIDEWMWHIRQRLGAKKLLVYCLLPPSLFGVMYFGLDALVVMFVAVFSCWLTAILLCLIDREPIKLYHPGSIITGLLIGMTCTSAIPLYMVVIGCCVAEFLGKKVFVFNKDNVFNPAVLGRSAIAIFETVDPVPYADLSTGASALFKSAGGIVPPEYLNAFLGTIKGAIGETSAILLLIVGFVVLRYVVVKRQAALALLLSAPLLVLVLQPPPEVVGHAPWVMDPLLFLIGGPTLLMAFFFLTDPSTTPKTPGGAIIFGVCVAVMAVFGKLYTNIAGVEMYGILIMNLWTPLLNKLTFNINLPRYRYE